MRVLSKQYVFLWYAYRMNVEAYNLGITKMLIAPGCVGTVADKSCYLDEFLDHIWDWVQSPTAGKGRTGVTVIDNSLSVDELAESIEVAGKSGGYYAPRQLCPDAAFWGKYTAGGKPGLAVVFDQITTDIQTIRAKASGDTTVTRFVDPIGDAIEQTTVARIQDSLADIQEVLREMMNDEGFKVVLKENVSTDRLPPCLFHTSGAPGYLSCWQLLTRVLWQGFLDVDVTYATNTGKSKNWKAALKDYVSANWDNEEKASKLVKHVHTISNCQYFTSKIKAPLPC